MPAGPPYDAPPDPPDPSDSPEPSDRPPLAGRLHPERTGAVRTYSGRHARMSGLTEERLTRLGPARELPPGPLDPQRLFGRVAPLTLEIGCGHGAAAVAYALTHPAHDLVALDVHVPGLARMLALAEQGGVGGNLRAARADAVDFLAHRVRPGQLDAVHLFFPDPWPKARHGKRRFVRADTLDLLSSRLAPGGHLRVATDQTPYVEHVVAEVAAHGGFTVQRVPRPDWRPVAGFEAKGLRAGREITDLLVTRRDARPSART